MAGIAQNGWEKEKERGGGETERRGAMTLQKKYFVGLIYPMHSWSSITYFQVTEVT